MLNNLTDKNPIGSWRGPQEGLPIPIDAGGYICGADQSVDGTMLTHWTDVANGMFRYAGDKQWTWALRPGSIPLIEYEPSKPSAQADSPGFSCLRIARSNKNIFYGQCYGRIWKTTDGGITFERLVGMGELYVGSNSAPGRNSNYNIDIHPTDPNIVLFGTQYHPDKLELCGPFYTLNGGTSKTKIEGLPAPTDTPVENGVTQWYKSYKHLVAIDPGAPANWYVFVRGSGIYKSANAHLGPFSLIAGSPTKCNQITVMANGDLWAAGNPGTGVNDVTRITRAGVVSNFSTGLGSGASALSVDPSNSSIIVAAQYNGHFAVSWNGGTNFSVFQDYMGKVHKGAGECLWLSNRNNSSVYASMLMHDKIVPGKVWVTHGTGIASFIVPADAAGSIILNDFSRGNAEKVATGICSTPNAVVMFNWDYVAFKLRSRTESINVPFQPPLFDNSTGLAIATDAATAADKKTMVMSIAFANRSSAISADDGESWQTLPGQQAAGINAMGAVAINTPQQIVLIGTNNNPCWRTKDGGQNWLPLQLIPGTQLSNQINAHYIRRHIIAADHTRPGAFALVCRLSSGPTGTPGLWFTSDTFDTATRKIEGMIGAGMGEGAAPINGPDHPAQMWQAQLEYIPGYSGELLYTPGNADYPNSRFYYMTGDGATLAQVDPRITGVTSFDFGPPAPGRDRPSVAFHGRVNGVWGLYFTYDWFTTLHLVSRRPDINLSGVAAVGCTNRFGEILVGCSSGWFPYFFTRSTIVRAA